MSITLIQLKKVFEIAQDENPDITWGYGIFQVNQDVILEFAYPILDAHKVNFLSEEAIDSFFINRYIISSKGEIKKEVESNIPKTEYKERTQDYEDLIRLEEPEDIKRCLHCEKEDQRKYFWNPNFCSEECERLREETRFSYLKRSLKRF